MKNLKKKKHWETYLNSYYIKRDRALQRLIETPADESVERGNAMDDFAAAHVAITLGWSRVEN